MEKKKQIYYHIFYYFLVCVYQKDKDFNTRLYLLIKYPDLYYKIAIISDDNSYLCCCGHGRSLDDIFLISNIKSILLVFETFKYMEDNNINYEAVKQVQNQIIEFFFLIQAKILVQYFYIK